MRIAKKSDPARLAELKQKILDRSYMDLAILEIAQVLTNTVVKERYGP